MSDTRLVSLAADGGRSDGGNQPQSQRMNAAEACSTVHVQVVWSDRVWSRDDWVGHKKVRAAAAPRC